MKEEGHLGRCYLKGHAGDAANAILTAVGYNFRRILAWLRTFCAQSSTLCWPPLSASPPSIRLLNDRLTTDATTRPSATCYPTTSTSVSTTI